MKTYTIRITIQIRESKSRKKWRKKPIELKSYGNSSREAMDLVNEGLRRAVYGDGNPFELGR